MNYTLSNKASLLKTKKKKTQTCFNNFMKLNKGNMYKPFPR